MPQPDRFFGVAPGNLCIVGRRKHPLQASNGHMPGLLGWKRTELDRTGADPERRLVRITKSHNVRLR